MKFTPFEGGNRLPIPASLGEHHFFYKTETPTYDPIDAALVAGAVRANILKFSIHPAEVDLLGVRQLDNLTSGASDAAKTHFRCFPDAK